MSGKFLANWQKRLYRNARTAFYVPIGAMMIEKFYLKNLFFFFNVFGHWVKNYWFFVKKFLAGLSKLQSTFWGERFIFEKNDQFWSNSVIQRKVSAVCGKIFGSFVITAFYLSIGTLWVEDCFWGYFLKIFVIFKQWAILSAFGSTSLHKDFTTALQVSRKIFWGKLDFLNEFFFFLSFCTLIGKFLPFCRKLPERVVKTDFYLSIENLWRVVLEKII